MRKIGNIIFVWLTCLCIFKGHAQNKNTEKNLYGYVADKFVVGKIFHEDKLDNQAKFSKNWVVQINRVDSSLKRYARIEAGKLEVHDPRGCTIWFKSKMEGSIMISYRIIASTKYDQGNDIVPRDINQFWMAQSPDNTAAEAKGGLFDVDKFEGDFKSYDQIRCYYASTGGGNTT